MDHIFLTDNDGETISDEQSSSDDVTSETEENVLPADNDGNDDDNDDDNNEPLQEQRQEQQQRMSNENNIHYSPVEMSNHSNSPVIIIKQSYQLDENEPHPFDDDDDDENRIIDDEHVQVSHVDRTSIEILNLTNLLTRLETRSQQRDTSNVKVCRGDTTLSQTINDTLNNDRRFMRMKISSRETAVRVSRISTSTTSNSKKSIKRKPFGPKPLVTRIARPIEQPPPPREKDPHVTVKRISVRSKKRSS